MDTMEPMILRMRAFGTVLLCMAAALALQGCLLTRVMETRAQLCDEQPPRVAVARAPGSGLQVRFEKPALTDRDVVWLVGLEPTEITDANGVRQFSYEALPLHRPHDRAGGLVVRLTFARIEGEYRLSKVELPEKFASILPPPLIEAAVKVVCKTQVGVVPPSTTFDLTSLDKAMLPNRDALAPLLGTPTDAIARLGEMSYQYCLAPCDSTSSMVANLRFSFGKLGELHHVDASYFRYSAVIDLISARATATVELH
jgi:hypothetical protein